MNNFSDDSYMKLPSNDIDKFGSFQGALHIGFDFHFECQSQISYHCHLARDIPALPGSFPYPRPSRVGGGGSEFRPPAVVRTNGRIEPREEAFENSIRSPQRVLEILILSSNLGSWSGQSQIVMFLCDEA